MTAAKSPDAPRVHRSTAVFHFVHGSIRRRKKTSLLAGAANVSEVVDNPVKSAPVHMQSSQTAPTP